MKKKLVFLSAVFAAAFFFSTSSFAMQIKMMIGQVSIERGGKTFPLKTAADIKDNDYVVTGEKSLVVFSFENGDLLRVKDKTKVLITNALLSGSGLTVVRGSIEAKFQKIARDNSAKICTPTTVASVRGTEFDVAVSDSGETLVQMKEGKLNISNPSGEIIVSGTESSESDPGNAPEKGSSVNSVTQWKADKDTAFKENPNYYAGGYQYQLEQMKERSEKNSESVASLNSGVSAASDAKQLDSVKGKIDETKKISENDYYMNMASTSLITMVIDEYGKDKEEIANEYNRIKEESNKVLDQQKRNLEEINKVLQAYQKAKSEIQDRYKKDIEEIKAKSKFK